MEQDLLQRAYDPNAFYEHATALTTQLTKYLKTTLSSNIEQTLAFIDPEIELQFWRNFLNEGDPTTFTESILAHTNHIHDPRYMGHQVAAPAPLTALTGLLGSLLNNGMAIYEMGMAPTAMERIVTDTLCENIGWSHGFGGFLTSGGSLANLTALLAARKAIVEHDVWNLGYKQPLGIMVSEEAHYCVDRAARIMGLGEKGIVKIKANSNYSIDGSTLDAHYEMAATKGIKIFAIVGSAPSTATGAYDNLMAIADFAKRKKIWFHVDGAHGGAAIFSKKYNALLQGIEHADSVVIDGHKMMLMPAITTALLFQKASHAHASFRQKADYLLSEEEDWFNGGKRTFECTKTMMSLHWYALIKFYGTDLFAAYVDRQYDLARTFAEMLLAHPNFQLALLPQANIVCFRYHQDGASDEVLNAWNLSLRESLLQDGSFYVVQTKLKNVWYLRTTLMNPFTTKSHLVGLLAKILEHASAQNLFA